MVKKGKEEEKPSLLSLSARGNNLVLSVTSKS